MKYFIGLILVFITGSCDDVTNESEPSDSPIQSSIYTIEAQRTVIGNEDYSASLVNGYLQKHLRFFEGDSLYLIINSDIVSENGQATAMYSVSGQKLTVNIMQTTTTYYEEDSSITFDPHKVVDESYTETIEIGSTSYTFEGPGLILHDHNPDSQDLDNDGNTSEMVQRIEYYGYSESND